jgi:hypothetical protein
MPFDPTMDQTGPSGWGDGLETYVNYGIPSVINKQLRINAVILILNNGFVNLK